MGNYDYSDLSLQQFTAKPATDFVGNIVGSCFYQATAGTDVFPAGATANFVRCSLTNCVIPAGCTVDASSQNDQIAEQNDGEDWVIDKQGKPARPCDEKSFDEHGLSKLPGDIPAIKVAKSVVRVASEKASAEKEITVKEAEIAKLKVDHGIPLTVEVV